MRHPFLSFSLLGLISALALLGAKEGSTQRAELRPDIYPPSLGAEPLVYSPARTEPALLQELRAAGKLTDSVRRSSYGRLEAHPLILRAASVLAHGLEPWAQGVYVTSLARSPEDQRWLSSRARYRWWTTDRSKHLMGGLAVDIGFVGRKASMVELQEHAQEILVHRLGADASKLRVVAEARCIHIEIDTYLGREIIDERRRQMIHMGIVFPEGTHPVPRMAEYQPEAHWLQRPRGLLAARAE